MKGICLFLITVIPLINGKEEKKTINIQKIVDEVNSDPTATWKASNYGFEEIYEDEIKSKLGVLFDKHHELLMKENLITKNKPNKNHHDKKNHQEDKNNKNLKLGSLGWDLLPVEYDARKEYPFCKSIGYIRDQANCGSCWAVSGASVLSDRFCIHSHGVYNMTLSGHYITACNYKNKGCRGGNLSKLWQFLEWYGTFTGDEYETDIGCQPYGIRPCGWPQKLACSRDLAMTPKCEMNGCNNEWYEGPEKPKRFYASESYEVGNIMTTLINEYQIKLEIFQNGPVQAGFAVYRDFLAYKSGVYAHKFRWFELPLGGHAVKIIGWGIEKGVKYWLVSNSWGEEWGEKGFFKIIRGRNDCFIESMVYAGMPEL